MRFHSNTTSFLIPDFVEVQRNSFIFLLLDRFVRELSNRRHIKVGKPSVSLFFYPEYYQLNYPEGSPTQAVLKGKTYSSKLYVPVQLVDWQTRRAEIQWALLGSLPLMTKRGHFVINGSPRVVVNQLVRSPGVYYSERYTKIKRIRMVWGDLIPERGAWLRLATDKHGNVYARLKRVSKISIPVFLRAFGVPDAEMRARSPGLWYYTPSTRKSALCDLYDEGVFENPSGRLFRGEIFYRVRTKSRSASRFLRLRFKNRGTYNLSGAGRVILNSRFGASVGTDRLTLTRHDVLSAADLLFKVIHFEREVDDIDTLENRRVRTSGELIANQINVALSRLSKTIRKRVRLAENTIHIQGLVTTKPLNGSLREFFGLNPLSQYMDQTNPLAEITHKRRVTSLGPGGIRRESAIQVRSIHPTYFGRVCPIETPEGKNAGLVSSITIYSKISPQGFLRTPFHKTYKGQVQSKHGVSLFRVNQEGELNLASSDLQPSKLGFLPARNVPVKVGKEYQSISSNQVDYSAVSPLQMLSVATSLIPFLEHNDANRALMGSNMQRQAVPVISTELPTVGTGLEPRAAADSSHLVQSKTSGYVFYASGEKISVQPFKSKSGFYPPCSLYRASKQYHATHGAGSNTGVKPFPSSQPVWGAVRGNTLTGQGCEGFCKTGFVFTGRVNFLLEPGSAKFHNNHKLTGRSSPLPCLPQARLAGAGQKQAGLLQGHTQVVDYLQRASFRKLPPVTPETPLLTTKSSKSSAPVGSKHRAGQRFQQSVLKRARPDQTSVTGRGFRPQPPKGLPCATQDQDQAIDASYQLPAFQSQDSMPCKSSVPRKARRKEVGRAKSWGTVVTRGGLFGGVEQTTLTERCVTGDRESPLLDLSLLPAGPIQGNRLVPCALKGSSNLLSCRNDHRDLAKAANPQGGPKVLPNSWFNLLEYRLHVFQRSNQDTCFSQKPAVNEGDWVQKGDLLADSSSTISGELALGRNLLLAYMPWEGYNFEDAILISERLLYDNLFTSIHVERYRVEVLKADLVTRHYAHRKPAGNQTNVGGSLRRDHLDWDGVVKVGSWVAEGDVLVGKVSERVRRFSTPYEQVYYAIYRRKPKPKVTIRNTSFKLPKGVEGRVVGVELSNPTPINKNSTLLFLQLRAKQAGQGGHSKQGQGCTLHNQTAVKGGQGGGFPFPGRRKCSLPVRLLKGRQAKGLALAPQEQGRGLVCMAANRSRFAIANPSSLYRLQGKGFRPFRLPPYRINVYLAESRKIKVGDKMSGRHGNKGIVSRVLPRQDMPYLPNGLPVDVVLNPLGVPSRMNVGQVFESLLGLAGVYLNQQFKILPFDELYGPETSRTLVYSKLYQARLKTGQSWLFNPETPGKVPLFDGRTGQLFDQSVTVGRGYMLKLIHLVDHKIHARSTGPYSLITQQPLRGKSKNGGQRVGEMEVWALEGFGAAHTLHELLTVKSDDMRGRNQVMGSILNQRPITLGRPAAFAVLIRELQSLCLQVEFFQLRALPPLVEKQQASQ